MAGPAIQLQVRRDTAAIWTATNPTLAEGEIGFETDTGWQKIGDGTTAWTALIYYHGPPWWAGLDGGTPASTYPGIPQSGYDGVMGSVSLAPEPVDSDGDPNWDDKAMYAVAYDGNNTILVSVLDYTVFGVKKLFVTDTDLSAPTEVLLSNITGWTNGTFKEFNHIKYSPTLSRWVAACGRGQIFYCSGDPSVAGNWTECTYPVSWNATGANIRNLVWDYGLQMFMTVHDPSGTSNDYIAVSIDGITWSEQDDHQVIGGSSPNALSEYHEFDLGATRYHVGWQSESTLHKTGNTGAGTLPGAASGWTKSTNGGIIRGSSIVSPNVGASDGSIIAISAPLEINSTDWSLGHNARWGPDGTLNEGWRDTDMGWPSLTYTRVAFWYLPQYARPWITFRSNSGTTVDSTEHGWFDAASIGYHPTRTAMNAPQFARSTAEPFKTMNDRLDADQNRFIASNAITGTNYAVEDSGNFSGHVLGMTGFYCVARTDPSRTADTLYFRKPG